VDLVLPRESYDRFAAVYPAQCGAGFALDLTDTWVPRARKAAGDAFVDLFVLDPLPDGKLARAWKLFRLRALQGMLKKAPRLRALFLCQTDAALGHARVGPAVLPASQAARVRPPCPKRQGRTGAHERRRVFPAQHGV
jgi:hypothetical protein